MGWNVLEVKGGPEGPVGVADGPLKGQRDAAHLGKSSESEGDRSVDCSVLSVFIISEEGIVSVVVVVEGDSSVRCCP
jgi:hypothetical protein